MKVARLINWSLSALSLRTVMPFFACALFLLFGAELRVVADSAQNDASQATSLASGQRVERELKGGQVNFYTISLRQGEYLHALVEQRGVDVIAKLWSPSGVELVKVNLFGDIGPEPISYLALEAGDFRLEVRAVQTRVAASRYSVGSLIKSRMAPEDQMRISAERLTIEAHELLLAGGTAELRRALEVSEQSLVQWRKLDDKYWHAYALNQIGAIYRNLGDREKAVDRLNEALSIRRSVRYQLGEAVTLYTMATLYSAPGERRKAQSFFTQALFLFTIVGDREAVAYTLEDIGRTYHDLGNTSKALKYYEQVLALARAIGYTRQEAVALTDIAIVHSHLHQRQKALQYYEQSLLLWKSAGDKEGEARTLTNIGFEYTSTGDKQKALNYYNQALAIYETLKDLASQSQTLSYIAEISLSFGKKENAIEFYKRISQLEKALGDHQAEAKTLGRLSDIYGDVGNFEEELQYRLPALALWKSLEDRKAQAETLEKIADAYNALDKYRPAVEYYQQSMSLWRDLKNREREADALRYIGGMYFALNEKRRALEPFKDALSLYQSLGDHGNAGMIVTMTGLVYYLLGERQTAWTYFDNALPFLKYPDVTPQASEQLISLPLMLVLFEDYESALKYYQRVAAASSGRTHRRLRAVALTNIGKIHSLMENGSLALNSFQRAFSLFHAMGDRNGEAALLNEIGKVYLSLRSDSFQPSQARSDNPAVELERVRANTERVRANIQRIRENAQHANEFFQQALSLYQALQNHGGEGATLISIGNVHHILGNNQEAFDYFRKALLLLQENPGSPEEGTALYSLMDISTDLPNPELAIVFGKQAVNYLQSMRSMMKMLDKNLERAFVHLTTDAYRELASLLIKQGRLLEAEQVLEMLKEEEFFRFVRRDDQVASELLKRINLSPAEAAALERYNKIAEKIVALGNEYGKLEAQRRRLPLRKTSSIVARQDEINKDLAAARITLSLFLDELKKEFGNQDKRIAAVEEGLQAEVKSWNEPRTVVVSTIVAEDSLSMVLTTAETQRAFIIDKIDGQAFSEEGLNTLIEQFRAATKDPADDPRPAGQNLYDVLIKPLDSDLQAVGANTIVWSLDANLRYIPMAALYDSQHGYLAERYASVIITLASHNNLGSLPTDQSRW